MEDFSLGHTPKSSASSKSSEDGVELNMQVSPICEKDGRKIAYVTFSDSTRNAEGMIPMCTITENKGFTDEEVAQLESYMQANLSTLKTMAKNVNIASAFLGKKN
ncbi:MAG: hypothetical protein K6G40_02630 [Eubacterium sp.]|nr:hypothetical protein [Eubacterium sp.]